MNFDTAWLSYGRLRPLHTNAVIFAFGGSALFATSYYVVQRTCQTRIFCDRLAAFTFWGGRRSSSRPPSPCRWATPAAGYAPNSNGPSTS
ncbi:cbb3-type cytochrome c oxidase subunit I [Achromobacter xylosoxidans]